MNELTDAERRLLAEKVKMGSEIDPIPKIPDAPDIAPAPKKGGVPGTFKNRIEGLTLLRADEVPVIGQHFVVWGSKLLDDIYARPVKKTTPLTEDVYAGEMRQVAWQLIQSGTKNPLHKGKDRDDRAEDYARWRYKGYVCGEVASL